MTLELCKAESGGCSGFCAARDYSALKVPSTSSHIE